MTEVKKTLKERRAESDKRIIESAIKRFGCLGYTYSSIRDIAKDAGITGGLITQRYGTKENLFVTAYENVMTDALSDVEADTSPRECLYSIIKDIEKLAAANPAAFEFCHMLYNTTDYPKELIRPNWETVKKTNVYKILKEAQRRKMLPKGALDVLIVSFVALVFHNISFCRRYKMEYPAPEKYLEFLHFNDQISMKARKWYRVLETAIDNTFDILVYMNIPENSGDVLKYSESFAAHEDFIDARRDIELTIQKNFVGEEQEKLREYLDLDTLSERMQGRKSVSLKTNQEDGSIVVHTILPITRDEEGNLTEILAGVYKMKQGETLK